MQSPEPSIQLGDSNGVKYYPDNLPISPDNPAIAGLIPATFLKNAEGRIGNALRASDQGIKGNLMVEGGPGIDFAMRKYAREHKLLPC